jgi:hypothetical protein
MGHHLEGLGSTSGSSAGARDVLDDLEEDETP